MWCRTVTETLRDASSNLRNYSIMWHLFWIICTKFHFNHDWWSIIIITNHNSTVLCIPSFWTVEDKMKLFFKINQQILHLLDKTEIIARNILFGRTLIPFFKLIPNERQWTCVSIRSLSCNTIISKRAYTFETYDVKWTLDSYEI